MMNKIGIINYEMGNIMSVRSALDFLGIENDIVNSPKELKKYSKYILPGVGSFNEAMINLNRLGFKESIKEEILIKKKNILGICLGMQLLAEFGEEDGSSAGLALIPGVVAKFEFSTKELKIPHIGFNEVHFVKQNDTLFKGLGDSADFYFVHSYRLIDIDISLISSYCIYGEKFISSVSVNNVHGTQFHPEKSQGNGLKLLNNFSKI
ncbi:MAG: imidazole glycerol phosphate synthase subunit HisH [Bacteroidales bacterium]|nr:imidazole glycerol phosphate synthase subunit HisH [Bacteroidales bacterium]